MTAPSSPRPNGFSEATGEICYDLPSSYIPHRATGLLHLPRFLAKARKHVRGELPKSYQRNFCKGFDRFLCLHLGVEPEKVIDSANFIDDLGADSLDTVELVMAFEEEFGVEIPDDAAEKILTVADAINFIGANGK